MMLSFSIFLERRLLLSRNRSFSKIKMNKKIILSRINQKLIEAKANQMLKYDKCYKRSGGDKGGSGF